VSDEPRAFRPQILANPPKPSPLRPTGPRPPGPRREVVPCACGGRALGGKGFHYQGAPGCLHYKSAPRLDAPKTALLGTFRHTRQWGILGSDDKARVALDLSGCNTISLFGVQGFGKSYTLGTIVEMAVKSIPGVNCLPAPLATIVFHYHRTDAFEPELLSALRPNTRENEVDRLRDTFGAEPTRLDDVVLLVPEAKVERRRREYPNLRVEPIRFHPMELKGMGWKMLLGAYGNDALYLRQFNAILGRLRDDLSVQALRDEIIKADMATPVTRLALDRLKLAEPFILDDPDADESQGVGALLKAGRVIIVDLRDAWIEKDQALELFVVLMNVFGSAGRDESGQTAFNRLMVLDEAHKYVGEPELVTHLVETVREMRHLGATVVIASQDPPSIPRTVLELSTVIVCHRMTSPAWLKHLRSAIVALEDLSERELADLAPGEAFVWAQLSTDRRFGLKPQRVNIRPRATRHGGATRTAVREEEPADPEPNVPRDSESALVVDSAP